MIRLFLPLALALAPADDSVAGLYDGGQNEIAAALELGEDGRFRYALSYGALDEEAAGGWVLENGRVLLTSDPATPPSLALAQRSAGPAGTLRIALEAPPGLSHQWFDLRLEFADGRVERRQMDEQDMVIAPPEPLPARVAVELPLHGLASAPAETGEEGAVLRFRFEPNDIGKADFRRTPLELSDGDLLLLRHERLIRFRRVSSR